jgi:hypothetical protein
LSTALLELPQSSSILLRRAEEWLAGGAMKPPEDSILNRIAYYQGRRDEAPNQELARELAEQGDRAGIAELVANLHHPDQNVRSDCLKTLHETGYAVPFAHCCVRHV